MQTLIYIDDSAEIRFGLASSHIFMYKIKSVEQPYIIYNSDTNSISEHGMLNQYLTYHTYFGKPEIDIDKWLEDQKELVLIRNLANKL